MNRTARWILFSLGLLAFVGLLFKTAEAFRPATQHAVVDGYQPWSEETLAIAETLPLQDGGRVKPLATYASFTLKRLANARSIKVTAAEGGEPVKVSALAWMLDTFFRPEFSRQMPEFQVEDSDVLRAIGVEPKEKRRARYSYDELEAGVSRLYELARNYSQGDPAKRTVLEQQVLSLAENVQSYERLLGTFDLVRKGVLMVPVEGVNTEAKWVSVSTLMDPRMAPMIGDVLRQVQSGSTELPDHVRHLAGQILSGVYFADGAVFLFPPADAGDPDWIAPGSRIANVLYDLTRDPEGSIRDIQSIERLSTSIGDGEDAFREELAAFKEGIVKRATDRGDFRSVELEAKYYRSGWFHWALFFFMLGTLLTIGMWSVPRTLAAKILGGGVALSTFAGWVAVVTALTIRCVIMQRPPVGNLYDTIIFIPAAMILFGAIVEMITRRGIALGALPISGALLILLSFLFETGDAKDHMDPLVAVLRSSFWLTTHVICIALGYASGLVTAVLSIIYVLRRGLGLERGTLEVRRALTRAVYGMVCLTVFLSLVGTVLGGIWANDSWGRFWGWDPKENGALLIVLLNLAILHARSAGFLREWGLHLASIFGAVVVTFSWWGVNMLNTGLHSYGFAEGKDAINGVYAVLLTIIAFGFWARWREKKRVGAASPAVPVEGGKAVEG